MPKVLAYRMPHDVGFAPNPFFQTCSLATCARRVRHQAERYDYVLGTASYQKPGQGGRAVFVMQVTELSDFDAYWNDERFQCKKPDMRGSRMRRYGDNIYSWDPTDECWIQADSRHSLECGVLSVEDRRKDTGLTTKVLLSERYAYWGKDGPFLPPHLSEFVRKDLRDKWQFSAEETTALIAWAEPLLGQGRIGRPHDWPR